VPKQGAFAKATLAKIASDHVNGREDLDDGFALVARMSSGRHFEHRLRTVGLTYHELAAVRQAASAAFENQREANRSARA
jgi:hypothetical protein